MVALRLAPLAILACSLDASARDQHELATAGVRGSETLLTLGSDSRTAAGVLFSLNNHSYESRGLWSARSLSFGFIGGGSADFEGGLGGELAGGLRVPFSDGHGPIARLGARGFLLGNELFYSSSLQLPIGQLGYQLFTDDILLEIAGSAGPVLTGRYGVAGATSRKLGGAFEWGGHAGLHLPELHLELGFARVQPDTGSSLGNVDRATALLCGSPKPVVVCLETRHLRGDVVADGSIREASAHYLGLQLGVFTPAPPGPEGRRAR